MYSRRQGRSERNTREHDKGREFDDELLKILSISSKSSICFLADMLNRCYIRSTISTRACRVRVQYLHKFMWNFSSFQDKCTLFERKISVNNPIFIGLGLLAVFAVMVLFSLNNSTNDVFRELCNTPYFYVWITTDLLTPIFILTIMICVVVNLHERIREKVSFYSCFQGVIMLISDA